MNTEDIRAIWLEDTLQEEQVPESALPRTLQGKGSNLVIRELSADEAGDIINACTDQKTQKLDQKKFMAMTMVASVRNGDDPDRALIWDKTFMQMLLSKGLKPMLQIAKQSIALSGLEDQIVEDAKNVSGPTIVEGSLSA